MSDEKQTTPPDHRLGAVNEADPVGHCAVEAACTHRCLDDAGVPRKFNGRTLSLWGRVTLFRTTGPNRIPHHQMQPGDVLRWQCPVYPANVHRWRVRSVCLGGTGQEGLIEMESLTHSPGSGAEFPFAMPIVVVPSVLVRDLEIEDVGERFGLTSSRRGIA